MQSAHDKAGRHSAVVIADPVSEGALDLEVTALVVHGAAGTADAEPVYDELVAALALFDVVRTGLHTARVEPGDGLPALDITWTADTDPLAEARRITREVFAPAAPPAQPAPPVATTKPVAQTKPTPEAVTVHIRNRWAAAEHEHYQQTVQPSIARAVVLEAPMQPGVCNGPGFRGRYGMLGDWHRG